MIWLMPYNVIFHMLPPLMSIMLFPVRWKWWNP